MNNYFKILKDIKNGAKIKINREKFSVFPEDTLIKHLYVSNNDASEKRIFVNLEKRRNVVLDFGGATMEVNGRITPFYFYKCKNITIKNVNIKFSRHYYFQAKITKIDGKKIFISPTGGDGFRVENGRIILDYGDEVLDYGNKTVFIQEFETNPVRVARDSNIRITSLGNISGERESYAFSDDGLCVQSNIVPPFKTGNTICFFCEQRISDSFVINECKNVKLENVNIYCSPAMGVIAQASENVKLKNVNVVRDENDKHIVTSLADATHFTNCRGKIILKNCTFENMNDDGTNVHGMYTVVSKVCGNAVEVLFKHFQQYGVKIYRSGDTIQFFDVKEKIKKFSGKVRKVETVSEQVTRLVFDKTPTVNLGDVVENRSANPKVLISGCRTGNNRPRGFLVSTPERVVISDCFFYNSECGIGMFADADFWFESGAFNDITVKNCNFYCNYGGGDAAISAKPSFKKGKGFFNGKLKVLNCTFNCDYGVAVSAYNTGNVILKNNVATVKGEKVSFTDVERLKDCGGKCGK